MHALLLSPAFPPELTGSGTLYYELARALVERGHRVTVIVARPRQRLGGQKLPDRPRRGYSQRETIDGIDVIRPKTVPIPLTNPIGKGLDHIALAATYAIAGLRVSHPDVVLVYSPPLTLGLAGWALTRGRNAPLILNVQDIFPQYAVDVGILRNQAVIAGFRWLERFLYNKAERIVVHSEGNREYLIANRAVAPARVEAIANWVDVETMQRAGAAALTRESLGLCGQFVLTYGGTMGWAQGLDVVLDAAQRLRNESNITFVLAGDGPLRAPLIARAERERLHNVRFLPLQLREKYAELLHASDVALISLNSKLTTPVVPGKLFDIMASGRPVLGNVPLNGDAARIVQESGAGLCVDADRGDKLSEAVLFLRDRQDLRAAMGARGLRHVQAFYSRSDRTDDFIRLLSGVAHATHLPILGKAELDGKGYPEVPPS